MSAELAAHYDRIVTECLLMAERWRREQVYRDISIDQHKRCILRAARYARLADEARPYAVQAEIAS